MEEAVARAADLIDRLEPMGLSAGLTEEDFLGDSVREPLVSCLGKVAAALSALPATGLVAQQEAAHYRAAVDSLKAASGSQRSASSGRLNAALNRLAAALDPPATQQPAAAAATGSSSSAEPRSRELCAEIIVAHLQAAAILAHKQPQQAPPQQQQQQQQQPAAAAAAAGAMEVDEAGDAVASAQLRGVARLLGLGDDPPPASARAVLDQVLPQLQALVGQLPPAFFQPLVSLEGLQPGQTSLLQEVDEALRSEYKVRRRMLIERIKVTLQSFLWSPRVSEKGTRAEVESLIAACQAQLAEAPGVTLAHLAQATAADLAGVMRRATSGEGGSIDASVKRVVIGKVPDRGGRPEGRGREANMPDWAPRRDTGGGGGGGGGGRGGHHGGRGAGGRGGGRGGGGGGRGQHGGGGGGKGGGGGGGGGRGGWGKRS